MLWKKQETSVDVCDYVREGECMFENVGVGGSLHVRVSEAILVCV